MTVDPSSCPPIEIQDALDRLIATADVVASRRAVDADFRENSILGAVLAAPILADRDHPPFDRATMDGYAIRAREANLSLTVEGSVAAGTPPPTQVSQGACVAIATGAAVPPGRRCRLARVEARGGLEPRVARVLYASLRVPEEAPHADVRGPRLVRGRPTGGDGGAVARHRQRKHLERIGAVLVAPLQPQAGGAEVAGFEAVRGATLLAPIASAARHRRRPTRPSL